MLHPPSPLISFLSLFLCLSFAACTRTSSIQSGVSSSNGAATSRRANKPAPLFELKDFKGNWIKLADLRGNVVVLHFWASWCPPCIEELPQWVETAKDFKGKPVKFVAVSLDKSWDEAHKIFADVNIPENLYSLIDIEKKVPDQYGSFGFPESYLLDKDLGIIQKWVGPQNWAGPAIKVQIRALF